MDNMLNFEATCRLKQTSCYIGFFFFSLGRVIAKKKKENKSTINGR
jgi:hypothetical protein